MLGHTFFLPLAFARGAKRSFCDNFSKKKEHAEKTSQIRSLRSTRPAHS